MPASKRQVTRPFTLAITALVSSLLVILLLLIMPLQADMISADPLTVCPIGPPDCDYSTIQAAVDGASEGDTIYVATGIYTGTGAEVALLDRRITLSGGWDVAFISQSGTSTIDGEGTRRGITVNSGHVATIDRFAIQNCHMIAGGGIYNGGTLKLSNSVVSSNTAETGGGVAIDYGAQAVITSTQIYANIATQGSGGGMFVQETGSLILSKSWVVANAASSNDGGGIYVEGGSIYIVNSIIAGNKMASEGDSGGGLVFGSGGPYRIVNSHIVGNDAAGKGAAIATFASTQVEVANTLIISNTGVTAIDDKYGNDTEFLLSYCDTYGNSPDGTSGVIINRNNCLGTPSEDGLDPLMIGGALPGGVGPAFAADWMSYNYMLQPGSPAIDAGTAIGTPADDIEGNPRIDGYPDLGAYETAAMGVFLTPQTQAKHGGRGQAVFYQIKLINATANTDTFTIIVGNNAWNTSFSDAQIGPVVAGESVSFTATVTVPVGVAWYLTDTAIITATSIISPLVYSDATSLTTKAYAPPKIEISPDVITSAQLVNETKFKELTISNGEGVTGTYMATIGSQAENFALAGSSSFAVANMISGDPGLNDYSFSVVGDDFSFADLQPYDGVIVSEDDGGLSEEESSALRSFYENGRPVILTMEGNYWLDPAILNNIYTIFGVTNAQGGSLEGGLLNTAHPIAQGASFSDLSTGDSDHFDEDGAVWVVKGNDGESYVLAYESTARTVIFGENFHEWWLAGNEQLIRNTIDWVAASDSFTSWLIVDPISGTIGTNGSQAISVTLDALNLQPDIYDSQITIRSNDPVTPMVTIPVTMTVLPTAGMGRIEGTVNDAKSSAPLQATIVAQGQPYTITTDPDTGAYVFWLEQGGQTLTVTAEGYVTGTATVDVVAQQATQLDFDLVLNVPVLALSSESLNSTQYTGEVQTQTLTITNEGPADLDFHLTIPGEMPIQHGLVAFYPFDGNANDESGNGNDATVEGALLATDRFGNPVSAFSFDGENDYIWKAYDAASGLHPTEDPFAITAWFKTETSSPAEQTIVSTHFAGSGDGYNLVVDANYGFRIRCFFSIYDNDVPVFSSEAMNDGEWHHVVCQWKDDVLYLYVDGQLQDTTLAVGTVAYSNEARFKIGHADNVWMPDSRYYFKGSIDDVALYNRALSEEEIQELFNWQGGSDAAWLSAEPVSGTLPGYSSAPIRVTIDASSVPSGTYHSWIRVISNDLVTPSATIPVSMTVLPRWDVFLPVLVKSGR